jgi:hypothetical protein
VQSEGRGSNADAGCPVEPALRADIVVNRTVETLEHKRLLLQKAKHSRKNRFGVRETAISANASLLSAFRKTSKRKASADYLFFKVQCANISFP